MALGADFLEAVKPFIYRKYLDHDAIEEIRRMKSQVEQLKPGTPSRDIKRGFGGIREIEFFIQIFQLMYGGRNRSSGTEHAQGAAPDPPERADRT
jgi:glutamate-ammonia-ligase adenylyltransferase